MALIPSLFTQFGRSAGDHTSLKSPLDLSELIDYVIGHEEKTLNQPQLVADQAVLGSFRLMSKREA